MKRIKVKSTNKNQIMSRTINIKDYEAKVKRIKVKSTNKSLIIRNNSRRSEIM